MLSVRLYLRPVTAPNAPAGGPPPGGGPPPPGPPGPPPPRAPPAPGGGPVCPCAGPDSPSPPNGPPGGPAPRWRTAAARTPRAAAAARAARSRRRSRLPLRRTGLALASKRPRPRQAQTQVHGGRTARVIPPDGGRARRRIQVEASESRGVDQTATRATGGAQAGHQLRALGRESVAIRIDPGGDVVRRAALHQEERADGELQQQRQTAAQQQAVPDIGERGRSPLRPQVVWVGGGAFVIVHPVRETIKPKQEYLPEIHVRTDQQHVRPAVTHRFGQQADVGIAIRVNSVNGRVDIGGALQMYAAVADVAHVEPDVLINLPVDADVCLISSRRLNAPVKQL